MMCFIISLVMLNKNLYKGDAMVGIGIMFLIEVFFESILLNNVIKG